MPRDGLINFDVSEEERVEKIEAMIVEKDTIANSVGNASSMDNYEAKQTITGNDQRDGLINLDVSDEGSVEDIEAMIVEKATIANSLDNASSMDFYEAKQTINENDQNQVVGISYIVYNFKHISFMKFLSYS